ncbi:MAG: ATP-dependent DNA helicase [Roseburia sp.]|nr:ATP-dependent DNA helicase [Roseburia sp.]
MNGEFPIIKISVRNLVEFILRSGDIDNRISVQAKADAMQQGSRIHRKIQRKMGASYRPEVPLKIQIETEKYILQVEGRADGIIEEEEVTIDEIKGVYRNLEMLLEPIMVHRAQAMCYAYIYAEKQELDRIGVQMTYCSLDTEEIKRFNEVFAFTELENWFYELIDKYGRWADFQFEWRKIMTDSIAKLEFPYPYREGQKKLAQDVYRTILRKKNLFIQAPTGTGKTLTTIFPAVKAVGEGLAQRIFYLTAKTITATVARDTFALFYGLGYRAKVILITAKEKICPLEEMDCNPVHCPYAKGHYDRVNDAVFDLISKKDFFTREVLLEQAEKYQVCPFEMCLDTASWSDDIVCDYNYVFDPNVHLKRFFGEGVAGDYIFLVDEAHNLVERGREMYSADLYKDDFLAARKILKKYDKKLEQTLSQCNKHLLSYKRECDTYKVYDEDISALIFSLMRLSERMDLFLQRNIEYPEKKEITDFYFSLRDFLSVYERVDEHYVIYGEHGEDRRFKMRLFCVDPSYNLQECLDKGRATIFFSATLLPIQFYKEMLGTKKDNYAVYATTSFKKDQKLLFIGRDVSSRYTRRNQLEFQKIARYIRDIVAGKKGNYMVFFPSYQLLDQVYQEFLAIAPSDLTLIRQESGMGEEQREEFLQAFEEESENSMAAFCVLGGIFGEGIDLKEERLIGAVIVGTGLPQIGHEREILKDYFEEKNGEGFDYAYRYGGMNKVLQAAGRVIRTTEDRGVIALLDDRFLESSYLRLFPREWEDYKVCTLKDVGERIKEFWGEDRE